LVRVASEFPAKVDDLNRELAAQFGTPPSAAKIAESMMSEFLADVVAGGLGD
jgi:hypothetical protein